MQGTVRSYDATSHSGAVLLDDGVELPFGPAAMVGSRLRHLRPGQRVRVSVHVDQQQITALTLATFPLAD